MYYVVGTKIYSANKDPKTNVYPEVRVKRGADGVAELILLSKGVDKRPKNRSICTKDEVLAKFGGITYTSNPPEDK